MRFETIYLKAIASHKGSVTINIYDNLKLQWVYFEWLK
jgi:hypothetical protein